MKTMGEYLELEIWAHTALQLAPKWSPYRLLWKFTIWYARKKQHALQ